MEIINDFYVHDIDLSNINKENVIMMSKKEPTKTVQDYRLISAINMIPKCISKVMANRLCRVLLDLIFLYQTTFIRGHYIAENFIGTRTTAAHNNYQATYNHRKN